jgi:hypothetical protein
MPHFSNPLNNHRAEFPDFARAGALPPLPAPPLPRISASQGARQGAPRRAARTSFARRLDSRGAPTSPLVPPPAPRRAAACRRPSSPPGAAEAVADTQTCVSRAACFNSGYKYSPAFFRAWALIAARAPGCAAHPPARPPRSRPRNGGMHAREGWG